MHASTLPGLPYVPPVTSLTAALGLAAPDAARPSDDAHEAQVGDLWLIGVEGVDLALAVVTEVNEHWAAVLPVSLAGDAPTGHVLTPGDLPALQVWSGAEASVHTGLLDQRILPVASATELAALVGLEHGPMPADVEATWASLNLGIDTGR